MYAEGTHEYDFGLNGIHPGATVSVSVWSSLSYLGKLAFAS
jgi:hypothetical protein